MSYSFNKLFSSITESTIWCEPAETKVVWITMLAKADAKGRVWGSVPGLANLARVSLEECLAALETLKSPDQFSRTQDHEGRRIEEIQGGWRLLNHTYYRNLRDEEARKEYKREWAAKKRAEERGQSVDKCGQSGPQSTQAEAEAEAEAEADKTPPKSPSRGKGKPAVFIAPDLSEIRTHWAEQKLNGDPEEFYNHFENCDWKLSGGRGAKMKNWKLAASNWSKRQAVFDPRSGSNSNGKLALPRNDEGLQQFAEIHGLSLPRSGETYPQYRGRLNAEVEKRNAQSGRS